MNNQPIYDKLTKLIAQMTVTKKRHPAIFSSIVMLLLIAITIILPIHAINLRYTLVFDQPLDTSTVSATYIFDKTPVLPSAAHQAAKVEDRIIYIRLDPLNMKSETMKIVVTGLKNNRINRFDAEVNINNHHLWTCSRTNEGWSLEWKNGTLILTFDSKLMNKIHHQSSMLSEMKVFLLFLLCSIWLILLVRFTLCKTMPLPWFASWTALFICIFLSIMSIIKLPALANSRFPYRLIAAIIMSGMLFMIIINNIFSQKKNKKLCLINYVACIAYLIVQAIYYKRYLPGTTPDEGAHVSYIAYEKVYHEIIPHFENMRIAADAAQGFSGRIDLNETIQFNQLGHPPLYYIIMSLMPGMHNLGNGIVTYNITLLRAESFFICLIGTFLAYYLFYTRIPNIPLLHLLAALSLISPPNFVGVGSGVSNDNLCLLTVTIFAWGVIRLYEDKYNWRTFILISLGISSTMLTKITAGMIVAIIAFFVFCSILFNKSKRIKIIRKTSLWISSLIYLIPLGYFLVIIQRYHAIQPSYQVIKPEEYYQHPTFYYPIDHRSQLSIWEYLNYMMKNFMRTWWYLPWQSQIPRQTSTSFTLDAIGITALLLIPFAIIFVKKDIKGKLWMYGVFGIGITILYQIYDATRGFFDRGYIGGYQSRYYLCAMVFLVFAIIWLIQYMFSYKQTDGTLFLSDKGTFVIGAFIMLITWDGFLSSILLHMADIVH